MLLLKKKKRSVLTNFIPMMITDEAEAKHIMSGRIMMKQAISQDIADVLCRSIPDELQGQDLEQQIRAGYIVNYADFLATQRSLIPLRFVNHSFQRPSRRISTLGTHAVVIINPKEFIHRVNSYYELHHGNEMMVDVVTAEYRKFEIDGEKYNIYIRSPKDAWKREILLTATMKQGVVIQKMPIGQEEEISIGDLSDIAVLIRVKDLVRGKFPERIMSPQYLQYMECFEMPEKGIQGWHFDVGGNVQNIIPQDEWILKFRKYLRETDWVACAFMDQFRSDAESTARLAFYKKNSMDRIFIKINHIEFYFLDYEEKEQRIVKDIVNCIESECDTRFCLLSLETNADLGEVKKEQQKKYCDWSECRTTMVNNLVFNHKIEMFYREWMNIFGLHSVRRSWHYTVTVGIPSDEKTCWYDANDVVDFFETMAGENRKKIQFLMRGGDAYARYHRMC